MPIAMSKMPMEQLIIGAPGLVMAFIIEFVMMTHS